MARGRPKKIEESLPNENQSYWDKVNREVQSNQSRLSLVLGALIVLVIGILVFNYFNRNNPSLGPSQTTEQQEGEDVSPDKLPGKYTVKEGDTLYVIAEKYYKDGNKYTGIAQANNMSDVNSISAGQVLEIPKLAEESPLPSEVPAETAPPTPQPSETPASTPSQVMETASPLPTAMPQAQQEPINPVPAGEKGAAPKMPLSFGPAITSDKYTIVEGDWLSKIAARAYNGDILAYKKLAEVNHIPNPDLIFPGQVLTIPR